MELKWIQEGEHPWWILETPKAIFDIEKDENVILTFTPTYLQTRTQARFLAKQISYLIQKRLIWKGNYAETECKSMIVDFFEKDFVFVFTFNQEEQAKNLANEILKLL